MPKVNTIMWQNLSSQRYRSLWRKLLRHGDPLHWRALRINPTVYKKEKYSYNVFYIYYVLILPNIIWAVPNCFYPKYIFGWIFKMKYEKNNNNKNNRCRVWFCSFKTSLFCDRKCILPEIILWANRAAKLLNKSIIKI